MTKNTYQAYKDGFLDCRDRLRGYIYGRQQAMQALGREKEAAVLQQALDDTEDMTP